MRIWKMIVALSGLLILTSPLYPLTLKLGSPAPEGSIWDKALRNMAVEWKKISKGKIRVKIYPGGIVGTENDMIRKIRIGQLQAGVFTSSGLSKISSDILALSLPKFIKNDDELNHILKKRTSTLDQLYLDKGFKPLSWSSAGWLYFFSKKPVVYPGDLKQQTLAVSASDTSTLQAWRAIGFNAVPLSLNNIMTGLQSGMVDAYFMTPLASATFQWFALAKNMCNLKIAPVIGNILVSRKTWKRIPKKFKTQLQKVTQRLMTEIEVHSRALEEKAISVMTDNGLIIHQVPTDAEDIWNRVVKKGHRAMIGSIVSKDLYLTLQADLQEYRRR